MVDDVNADVHKDYEYALKFTRSLQSYMPQFHRSCKAGLEAVDTQGYHARTVSQISNEIMERANELQDAKHATSMQKRKAFTDLMNTLKEMGLSSRRADIDPQERAEVNWFFGPRISSSRVENVISGLEKLYSDAEKHYFKFASLKRAVDERSQDPSKDLGVQDIQKSKQLCEHIQFNLRSQRTLLSHHVEVLER